MQARVQLGDVEGLGEVVVAAGVEAAEAVREGVAGGQEQDGDAHAASAERLAHVAPIGIGQPDVDDQDVGGATGGSFDEAVPGGEGGHVEALGDEAADQDLTQVVVVLYEQQPWVHDAKYRGRRAADLTGT